MKPSRLICGLLCLGVLANLGHSQSPAEKKLIEQLTAGSTDAIDAVLTKSEEVSPVTLYMSAALAFKAKRLEDSGFLFYAAKLRASFDRECFSAKGKGGDSPFVLYGALAHDVGTVVTPAVMAEPKAFAKVLERLKKWSPKAPKNHDPAYEYTERKSEQDALEAVKADRTTYEKSLAGLATLLNDAEYFASFRIVQAYNLGPGANRPTEKAYKDAVEAMKTIEKAKGIQGFATITSQ